MTDNDDLEDITYRGIIPDGDLNVVEEDFL